jgi:hypothetical protein
MTTLDALQVNQSISKIPLPPIQEKLQRYEVFLQNNMSEIHRKHGIDMLKPTFIENLKNNMIRSVDPRNGLVFDAQNNAPKNQFGHDEQQYQEANSFEEEVAPI